MRHRLEGNWTKGLAFDWHTLASTYLGDDAHGRPQFDNTRKEQAKVGAVSVLTMTKTRVNR